MTWQGIKSSAAYHSFIHNKVAMVSAFAIFIICLLSALAPIIAPFDPWDLTQFDIMDSEIPPVGADQADERFFLGTDAMGRDMLSTILYGTGISILIGVFATLLELIIGVTVGLFAGYYGGKLDGILMRVADIQLSFTTLMVAIVLLAVFQATLGSDFYEDYVILVIILVIAVSNWPQSARTVRACVLAEKEKEYVDAAKVIGLSPLRIIYRHIFPNTFSPLLVIATVQVAGAIVTEAALSFLGLGMPVTKPSLGSLIRNGFEFIFSGSWWITAFPSIILIILILSINLLGDWLRDLLNPKLYGND